MPDGTTRDCPGYTGILSISGSMGLHPCLMGLPGTVLGIPGYLVSRDIWDSTPGGTTRDCPGYTGILSTSWVCDTGVSHVSRDVPSCPGTSRGSTGHPSQTR